MNNEEANIYYFTGTGNSLKISKDIIKEINNSKLLSISKLMKNDKEIIIQGETVGFIFPTYFARCPIFIEKFIDKVSFKNVDYIFAIINGGGLFGKALKIFSKCLLDKGVKLNAGFTIAMPGNHPKVASLIRKSHQEFFQNEKVKINKIVELIKEKKNNKLESNFGLLGSFLSYIGFKNLHKRSENKDLDKELWVNEKCIGCGTCEELCPVNNITLFDKKPKWHHNCINCISCYHHCPQEAIQMKNDNMPRYHNPEILIDEMNI